MNGRYSKLIITNISEEVIALMGGDLFRKLIIKFNGIVILNWGNCLTKNRKENACLEPKSII